jgi:ABC-2 type transport system permease protein
MNVTPVGKFTLIISKLIPYWAAGFVVATLCMFTAFLFYGMIPKGSIFQNMPEWAQILGNASPLKYFIQTLRMVYLKGATFVEMQHLFYPLCGLAVFFNGWAVLSYRKKSS